MTPEGQTGSAPAPAPKRQARYTPIPETGWKPRIISFLVSWLIRLYCLTLRIRIVDRSGLESVDGSVIWAFWHNRLLVLPVVYRRWAKHRPLCILTSPSRDGAVLAGIVKRFGMGAVRGSSNKRAAQALVECRRRLLNGSDLGISPDGPRGPMYVAAPGVIQLARLTGRPLMPMQVEYSRKWRLKSWDRFQIPKPFSRVTVTSLPPVTLAEETMEEACLRLTELLGGQREE
jgi:lysophospholipid acyltransferase (LPLAT)-like uncharacterized protein